MYLLLGWFNVLYAVYQLEIVILGDDNTKRRRRKASLSGSEIMTILLYFHFGKFCIFKHYYLFFLSSRLLSRTSLMLSLTTVLLNLNVGCFSLLCSFLICVHLEDVQVLHLLTQQWTLPLTCQNKVGMNPNWGIKYNTREYVLRILFAPFTNDKWCWYTFVFNVNY